MKQLEEIEIGNEVVFFRKGLLGWHVVYPHRIKGKINWKNLIAGGNWWKLLIIAIVVGIILGSIYEYSNAINEANDCLARLPKFSITP